MDKPQQNDNENSCNYEDNDINVNEAIYINNIHLSQEVTTLICTTLILWGTLSDICSIFTDFTEFTECNGGTP